MQYKTENDEKIMKNKLPKIKKLFSIKTSRFKL